MMKKIILLLGLLLSFAAHSQQWVIWNNELWFKSSPTDSVNYGPSYLQAMIEVIKGKFDNVEANKMPLNNIPEGTIGIPFYRRVSGSNATTTGQALTDVTGLSASLLANSTYEFEANMTVSTSAVTTGTQYAVNYSAAGSTIEATLWGSSTTTAMNGERVFNNNTASTTYLTTSGQSGVIRITGAIIVGANAGAFSIRHLKVTSGTSTVFINSFLKLTKIQ